MCIKPSTFSLHESWNKIDENYVNQYIVIVIIIEIMNDNYRN